MNAPHSDASAPTVLSSHCANMDMTCSTRWNIRILLIMSLGLQVLKSGKFHKSHFSFHKGGSDLGVFVFLQFYDEQQIPETVVVMNRQILTVTLFLFVFLSEET